MSAANLVLIGFMGSGKSSAGRLLAKARGLYFLDTDSMIESLEGKDISKIFADEGEEHFRLLELKTVQWLKNSVKNAVISTGGGMVTHCEGLKEVGRIIYLNLPFEAILSRLDAFELAKRPLFSDVKKAEQMYRERHAIYTKKADIIIDAEADIQSVLTRVCAEIDAADL
ncbi:MAG: shikimate kinase [Campylobacterales bacterium]|nr:shikimate kinase [Campylobacterales bacterium]